MPITTAQQSAESSPINGAASLQDSRACALGLAPLACACALCNIRALAANPAAR
jgi:hypothetical protein